MDTHFSFAPMEGVTPYIFRQVHSAMFPGADLYYAPFIAPDKEGNFRLSRLKDIQPGNNTGICLIPQVLANNAQAFLSVSRQLADLGYKEINLNAGCPSGTVVAKHKGAGMLADLLSLDAFLDEVCGKCEIALSVKTRLGMENVEEFPAILEIYNRYSLSRLIIHARVRKGMYQSVPDQNAFLYAFEHSRNPVCYNGNIFSPGDLDALLQKASGLEQVMIGRGAAANPALFRMLRGGAPATAEEMRLYHDTMLDAVLDSGISPVQAMARLKELWYYMIWMFPGSGKEYKALNKSRDLPSYRAAVSALFANCEFDPLGSFHG